MFLLIVTSINENSSISNRLFISRSPNTVVRLVEPRIRTDSFREDPISAAGEETVLRATQSAHIRTANHHANETSNKGAQTTGTPGASTRSKGGGTISGTSANGWFSSGKASAPGYASFISSTSSGLRSII